MQRRRGDRRVIYVTDGEKRKRHSVVKREEGKGNFKEKGNKVVKGEIMKTHKDGREYRKEKRLGKGILGKRLDIGWEKTQERKEKGTRVYSRRRGSRRREEAVDQGNEGWNYEVDKEGD